MNLGAAEFEQIAKLAYSESGLQLVAEKTSMIQSRLRHRLKALGIPDFRTYTNFVCSSQGLEERRQMISALTTNVSHFFREQHHFDILAQSSKTYFLERLFEGRPMRIWSAGCSNGQEATSVAITMLNMVPDIAKYDFKILATDIDPNVVEFARQGVYPERLMGGVPAADKVKYFSAAEHGDETSFTVKSEIQKLITFKELNLLSSWPMKMQMDFIFCRNVVIYFDLKTQNALWPRFHSQLKPDGYLFLGHSERVANPESVGFDSCGPTAYRPLKK
ncbi:MAG: protein-glutamate O-methyltransferase CheR [Roseobacter sp.]